MPESVKASVFFGLFVKQADFGEAQVFEDLQADHVVPVVGFEAQLLVGFHRVAAFVLEFVGFELRQKSNAPALLRQIDHDALAFAVNHFHRHVQLVAAVAAEGIHQIPGEARGVHADQRRFAGGLQIAPDHRQRFLVFVLDAVADEPGVSEVGCGDDHVGFAVHQAFPHSPMPDEFLNRDDRNIVLGGDFEQLIEARHVERGLAANLD